MPGTGMLCQSMTEAFSFVPTQQVYSHYKGGVYLILNNRVGSAKDGSQQIYYVCLWSPHPNPELGPYYVRDYNDFHEYVESEEYDYKGPRFRLIGLEKEEIYEAQTLSETAPITQEVGDGIDEHLEKAVEGILKTNIPKRNKRKLRKRRE